MTTKTTKKYIFFVPFFMFTFLFSNNVYAETQVDKADFFDTKYNIIFSIIAASVVVLIIILQMVLIIFNKYKRTIIEKALADNRNTLRTFINSTPDLIYIKDSSGNFVEINNSALELLNSVNKNSDTNKNKLSLTNATFETNDKKAFDSNNAYRTEEVILDENKDIHKIYDTLRLPLFNNDRRPREIMLIGRDITEHKQNEENEKIIKELRHYDELKNNFFSNISHEFRTPLNLIFSSVQTMELKFKIDNTKDTYTEKYTTIVKQNCNRLLRIMNNLIDITKLDSESFMANFHNGDIIFIIENIVMSTANYIENRNINITFDTEVEEKIMAFDIDSIERIMLNLLSNAIKFTPSGGNIYVNIEDKLDYITISVKDTGDGIPKDKQNLIFKKFIQVDKSLSRNTEGTGIGLSLVKKLIDLHKGTIQLKSSLNEGSTFKVTLPVRIIEEDSNYNYQDKLINYNIEEKVKIEFSDIYDY